MLGHVKIKQLNKLVMYDLVRGLKDVTFEKDELCSACQAEKQVGNTHPKKSMMSTSKAFELLHMDLFGLTTYTCIGGNKYGFVIVDDFTRYTWVVFLLIRVIYLQPLRHSSRELLVFINSTLVLDSHILIIYTSSFIIPGCHPRCWKQKVFKGLFIISCD
jgi:hypothetical protein